MPTDVRKDEKGSEEKGGPLSEKKVKACKLGKEVL